MSDLVPPEKPTGEIGPLRPKSEPKNAPVNPGLKPPWRVGESGNPSGRIAASLLPHEINLNVGLDAETFVRNFRQAVALLGNEPPPCQRRMKVIDADDADHH